MRLLALILIPWQLSIVHALDLCSFDLDARPVDETWPLILQHGDFIYPNGSRLLSFVDGDNFELLCHGGLDSDPITLSGLASSELQVTCRNGRFQDGNGNGIDPAALTCARAHEPDILVLPSTPCAAQGADGRTSDLNSLTQVEIGWTIRSKFYRQILLCVDEKFYATLWTKHEVIGWAIRHRDMTSDRPSFKRDAAGLERLFSLMPSQTSINNAYSKQNEADQMVKILGANELSDGTPIIDTGSSGTEYFARGHLSPDAAFVHDAFQQATYYFVNVAPQYQTFNNGNWKGLEGAVRKYADSVKRKVDVYTGTHGFLKYPDTTTLDEKSIFLYTEDGHEWIPTPNFFWKVIHDKEKGQAMAFIGLNDAHASTPPPRLCHNQCNLLSWAAWDAKEDLESGLIYCCKVEELRQQVPNLPDLQADNGAWPKVLTDIEELKPEVIPTGTCVIDIDEVAKDHAPFLLSQGKFLLPQRMNSTTQHRIILIDAGETVQVVCHGTEFNPSLLVNMGDNSEISLTCKAGKFVDINGNQVGWRSLECSRIHEPKLIVQEDVACATEGINGRSISQSTLILVQLGWQIGDTFHEQIRLCQDKRRSETLWTHHVVLGQSIAFRDKDVSRPDFRRDVRGYPDKRFFPDFSTDKELNDAFTKDNAVKSVMDILGANAVNGDDTLIDSSTSGTNYFAKGHLAPDAAFVHTAFQDATYYYINVAPQFQSFNNGNWKALEGAVRDYAKAQGSEISVYTGTYGLLYYPDTSGTSRKLYLAQSSSGTKLLEPPKYYWKVVHNPAKHEAVVFVGLNDPHATSKPNLVCSNVCQSVTWADWEMERLESGFMYCCTVQELREHIDYVPDLRDDQGNWPKLLQN